MMKVMRIREPGGPEVLMIGDAPVPSVGAFDIRVAVRAAGVNRADVLQRLGRYPAPAGVLPDVPGLEYAGVVDAVGPAVSRWAAGDRVMGLVGGGGYAEAVVVHQDEALPMPAGLDFAAAAAIPEVFITAYDALHLQAGLTMGERVLIHAVGSGVGTAAVQLVRAAGATPLGTSRTAAKIERARRLGLADGVVPDDGRFAKQIKALTGGAGVEVILDLVGGDYVAEGTRALARRGRLVLVGLLAGIRTELPLATVLTRRLHITGTVLRSRGLDSKIAVARAFASRVIPMFNDGRLEPVVAEVMPMTAAGAAHRRMTSNDLFGKLILTW